MENTPDNKSNLPTDAKAFQPATTNQQKNETQNTTTVSAPATGNGKQPGEQQHEPNREEGKKISDTPGKTEKDGKVEKSETTEKETQGPDSAPTATDSTTK